MTSEAPGATGPSRLRYRETDRRAGNGAAAGKRVARVTEDAAPPGRAISTLACARGAAHPAASAGAKAKKIDSTRGKLSGAELAPIGSSILKHQVIRYAESVLRGFFKVSDF